MKCTQNDIITLINSQIRALFINWTAMFASYGLQFTFAAITNQSIDVAKTFI